MSDTPEACKGFCPSRSTIPQFTDCSYVGNTSQQIQEHKLACSVINYHGTPNEVFDDNEFDLLKRFTVTGNMSVEARDAILQEKGWVDEAGSRPGMKAATQSGSLAGFLIARSGTNDPALDDRDWELLRDWFERGMPVGEQVRR